MADIKAFLKQGEGISVEFKTCRSGLNRDVYETVCAFLNRHGGTLLLGVNDSGEVAGVDPDCVEQIKKDFVTAINNPQKINPPCYLSVDEIQIDGKVVLHILVPESSQAHGCNGRIFDRNEDGDFDITNHTAQIASLYQRKQATFSENKVYPLIGLKDLRTDLIDRCRKIARVNTRNHPWATMDDQQLIQSAQLHQTDPLTGKSGVTLAGILLLGSDQLILSVVPAHRTDLILRKVNLDRYDDRDLVRTNLIDSYDHILAFIHKHLPDPFYLDGIERISLRDVMQAELFDASMHDIIKPGVIFCLHHTTAAKEEKQKSVNPLNPYYLLYIREDGEVRFTFMHPKQILSMYQALCRGQDEPFHALCEQFDCDTNDGRDMDAYSSLLKKAVRSVAHTFRKRTAAGLQAGRDFVIPDQNQQANDSSDFELITWLVIKPEHDDG